MTSFISSIFFGIRDLLNGINNTVWGVTILFCSMIMYVRNHSEAALYFAGIGSTLLGMKQEHPQTTNFNNSTVQTPGPMNSATSTTTNAEAVKG